LADAYCARSAQLGDLGRLEEALPDANSAMRLAPDTTSSLGCRAQVYFQAGQFDKAVADYTRAISFGSTEAWTFRDRGVSRFYPVESKTPDPILRRPMTSATSRPK